MFHGAIACSAPVLAKLDFFEYMEVVADSLGPVCTAKVRQATESIKGMLSTDQGRDSLATMFNTCKRSISNNKWDIVTFLEDISDPICGMY